jgi:hypothetical protein
MTERWRVNFPSGNGRSTASFQYAQHGREFMGCSPLYLVPGHLFPFPFSITHQSQVAIKVQFPLPNSKPQTKTAELGRPPWAFSKSFLCGLPISVVGNSKRQAKQAGYPSRKVQARKPEAECSTALRAVFMLPTARSAVLHSARSVYGHSTSFHPDCLSGNDVSAFLKHDRRAINNNHFRMGAGLVLVAELICGLRLG